MPSPTEQGGRLEAELQVAALKARREDYRSRENGIICIIKKSSQIWDEIFIQIKIIFRLLM